MAADEAGTPDRVELARQSVEALGRFDFDAWLRVFAPDAAYDASSSGVGAFKGVAAIRRFAEDWLGSYEEYEGRVEENDDLGNGVTFTVALWDGRLRGSTARVQERWSYASANTRHECFVMDSSVLLKSATGAPSRYQHPRETPANGLHAVPSAHQ